MPTCTDTTSPHANFQTDATFKIVEAKGQTILSLHSFGICILNSAYLYICVHLSPFLHNFNKSNNLWLVKNEQTLGIHMLLVQ